MPSLIRSQSSPSVLLVQREAARVHFYIGSDDSSSSSDDEFFSAAEELGDGDSVEDSGVGGDGSGDLQFPMELGEEEKEPLIEPSAPPAEEEDEEEELDGAWALPLPQHQPDSEFIRDLRTAWEIAVARYAEEEEEVSDAAQVDELDEEIARVVGLLDTSKPVGVVRPYRRMPQRTAPPPPPRSESLRPSPGFSPTPMPRTRRGQSGLADLPGQPIRHDRRREAELREAELREYASWRDEEEELSQLAFFFPRRTELPMPPVFGPSPTTQERSSRRRDWIRRKKEKMSEECSIS